MRRADFILNHSSGQTNMMLAKLMVYILISVPIIYNMAGNKGGCQYTPWLPECRSQRNAENKKSLMPGKNRDLIEPEVSTAKDLTTVSTQVQLSGKYLLIYLEKIFSMSRLLAKETTSWCVGCLLDLPYDFFPRAIVPAVSIFANHSCNYLS